MHSNTDAANSLEQLLESLIKMVGKANQNMNNLQIRVNQLECLIRVELKERGSIPNYSTDIPAPTFSETH